MQAASRNDRPVLAIVGAGRGMGLEIARVFGRKGFSVALMSRNLGNVTTLAEQLEREGIQAKPFVCDVRDRPTIISGLARVKAEMGDILILEYSPSDPSMTRTGPLQVTEACAQAQFDFYVHGCIAAVQCVLPGMLERKRGTILVTSGASPTFPSGVFSDVSMAAAALRSWTLNLHQAAAPHGVQVAHIEINATLGQMGISAADVAPLYIRAHEDHSVSDLVFTPPTLPNPPSLRTPV
ncbi:putative short-chain dehydrogenase [Paratrimastix pyriformis]|uniref:Short-chain dehydrogenase n=1 Tax=Paratrimastix pyriformis TaxID=342808 RepID=A0ABQ8UKA2_9EUKA|nr:putative short-chain dehydrogenase [Paratrimastix pyriformis]